MSFFDKISKGYTASNVSQKANIESITEQIEILFSNRYDQYWAYDFKKNEIIPIHEVFKVDYFLPEFAKRLTRAIEVFDNRLSDINVKVTKSEKGAKIIINGSFEIGKQKNPFQELVFYI